MQQLEGKCKEVEKLQYDWISMKHELAGQIPSTTLLGDAQLLASQITLHEHVMRSCETFKELTVWIDEAGPELCHGHMITCHTSRSRNIQIIR